MVGKRLFLLVSVLFALAFGLFVSPASAASEPRDPLLVPVGSEIICAGITVANISPTQVSVEGNIEALAKGANLSYLAMMEVSRKDLGNGMKQIELQMVVLTMRLDRRASTHTIVAVPAEDHCVVKKLAAPGVNG